MSLTKLQLVDAAFEELALAGFTFDITAAERATALLRLDSMMATWEARGVSVGYFFGSSTVPTALTNDSDMPAMANEAVYTNLAVRLCATFGKQPPASLLATAKDALLPLLMRAATPEEQLAPGGFPLGAGRAIPGARVFTPEPQTSSISLDIL
jgi:hypothetical protein